jgi:UDP-N-acetylglucosamine/UDP-N-acetylgalactosamine 4-epimerase
MTNPPMDLRNFDLPGTWLVTGVAGFIGSHLAEALLSADRAVIGLDNFATGTPDNLAAVAAGVQRDQRARFRFVEGDVRDADTCREVMQGVDVVLHQAALNSVPRSLAHPGQVLDVNTIGTTNLFRAADDAGVRRVVYASSSSVYGDVTTALRTEWVLGDPLSPYAVSKRAVEQLATVYHRIADIDVVGLRYFNVFGPRQNPNGPYSAVIPRWIDAMLAGESPVIYGEGKQSRDFTYVGDVVCANVLAAMGPSGTSPVYNVGAGRSTSVRELFETLRDLLGAYADVGSIEAVSAPPRVGDVASALADLTLVSRDLGYRPRTTIEDGLRDTVAWFAGAGERARV